VALTVAAASISIFMCAPAVVLAQVQAPTLPANPALQQNPAPYQNSQMPQCLVKWKTFREQNNAQGTDAFRAFMSDCLGVHASVAAPDDWKKFLNGRPFVSTTSSNLQFRMVLTPDGKMTRDPIGTTGSKGEGTWTLSGNGLCTVWADAAKPNCFVLRKKNESSWSVMSGSTEVAVWTTSANSSADNLLTKTANASEALSANGFYALRNRLASLWNVPANASNPDEPSVRLRLKLKPDGVLASPPLILSRGNGPSYVAAQDSAIRAIFNAQPYTMLKPESYEEWKDIEITFGPRGVTAASATPEHVAQAEAATEAKKETDPASASDAAPATPDAFQQTVNVPGSIRANSVGVRAGKIVLNGGDGGIVKARAPTAIASAPQASAAPSDAQERGALASYERALDFSGAGAILRAFTVHATLLIAAFGQLILIVRIIFGFASSRHEKIMRCLAAICGLLIYVGMEAAGISIPDAMYRALSTSIILAGFLGVLLPSAAGLLVAWYVIGTLRSGHPEQNVVGMRILSITMTYVFFLYCDTYASYGVNEKKEFFHLLPNFAFVLSMLLYALLRYHPHGAEVAGTAQSLGAEDAQELEKYAGGSFRRRQRAVSAESSRSVNRGAVAPAREHVSLASTIRARVN
jgi:hypothetical protein